MVCLLQCLPAFAAKFVTHFAREPTMPTKPGVDRGTPRLLLSGVERKAERRRCDPVEVISGYDRKLESL